MEIPQAGPLCTLASPDAPSTKSLESGCLFPPAMFLWLMSVQRMLETRSWGVDVGLCLSWRYLKTGSVYSVGNGGSTSGLDEGSPHPLEALGKKKGLPH